MEELCLAFEIQPDDDFIETRSRQLVLTITRTNNAQFSAESCQSHLNDIISRCIAESRSGGTLLTDGGFLYEIYVDKEAPIRTISSSEDFNAAEKRTLSARAPQSKAKKGKPKSKGKSSPKGKTPQAKVPSVAEILKKLNLPKDKIMFYSGNTPFHKKIDA